jgi:hypothetical protein
MDTSEWAAPPEEPNHPEKGQDRLVHNARRNVKSGWPTLPEKNNGLRWAEPREVSIVSLVTPAGETTSQVLPQHLKRLTALSGPLH